MQAQEKALSVLGALLSVIALLTVAGAVLFLNGSPFIYQSVLSLPYEYLMAVGLILFASFEFLPESLKRRLLIKFFYCLFVCGPILVPYLRFRVGDGLGLGLAVAASALLSFLWQLVYRRQLRFPILYWMLVALMPLGIFYFGYSFSLSLYAGIILGFYGVVFSGWFIVVLSLGGDMNTFRQMLAKSGALMFPVKAGLMLASSLYGGLPVLALLLVMLPVGLTMGCEPIQPSVPVKKQEVGEGEVSFHFEQGSLQLLQSATLATELIVRIRISPIADGRVGEQEGSDFEQSLTETSATIKLQNIKLGEKKFQVHILNERREVVGEGEFVTVVNLGLQQLSEPLTIKLREPERRRRSLPMRLIATIAIPDQPEPINYLQLKPLLREYCISCHNASSFEEGLNGGLDLANFPFRSISERYENQQQIVEDMIYSMGNDTEPMPPEPPFVPYADIDKFKTWVDAGLPARPGGANASGDLVHQAKISFALKGGDESGELTLVKDENGDLVGSLPDAIVSGKYDLSYRITAKDGRETYAGTVEIIATASGDLLLEVVIPYSEPVLDIPIVVEP